MRVSEMLNVLEVSQMIGCHKDECRERDLATEVVILILQRKVKKQDAKSFVEGWWKPGSHADLSKQHFMEEVEEWLAMIYD